MTVTMHRGILCKTSIVVGQLPNVGHFKPKISLKGLKLVISKAGNLD